MRKQSLILSVAVALIAFSTACKKENNVVNDRPLTAAAAAHTCGDSTISGVITSNLYLGDCKIYKLSGIVYVSNNATLTIAPGALVQGIKGAPGGTLVITRGAKINAAGTQTAPILFTSDQASPVSGDWGGVVVLGKANINQGDSALVEGIGGTPPASAYYGGTVTNDNSGVLTYVRIEYAGYELSTDNELNGLTLAGVGSGTTVHHVEVYKSKDDAFEFFGGSVNASYLIAAYPLDDMYDFDNSYSGTINYALGLSDQTRADKSQSNGIECDNLATGDSTKTPITKPVINHMTIIGLPNATLASTTTGAPSGTGRYGRGAHFRRSSRFDVRNSIFMGFNTGISLDASVGSGSGAPASNTPCAYFRGLSVLDNNLVHAFTSPYGPFTIEGSSACLTSATLYALATNLNGGYVSADPNTDIKLVAPFGTTAAGFFPQSTGEAFTYNAGAFTFGGADWTVGFSRFGN
ncbi:hypothetical protein [Chitinophaga pinensis]|uniref:T9SS C-terminal target domain-containing protein n=1 Tax=Chitinophaga pinensis (strain ATCC 43595 / DSM 2588 / LMG 13176 / NBRC 15968 / NCIMB 11800 / UQM 2034) TaxID=485918 RepID=A0A979G241_CHIPD|nr:hypothetical protein [Chitinophaga pinensis]ACU59213.1 hypothetical protein Cpin_1717 [Chitinophaga pinensis DSM 2588]